METENTLNNGSLGAGGDFERENMERTEVIQILSIGKAAVKYGDRIMSWRLNDSQTVPAIERCKITIVKFPVQYYTHFYYGPELMAARKASIKKLGWSSHSFDLPEPPVVVNGCSLLGDAILEVRKLFGKDKIGAIRNWPTGITFFLSGYKYRMDYYALYFNQEAHEFYDILFEIGQEHSSFNLQDVKLDTLPQMLKWAKSHEAKRKRLFKKNGFTWKPIKLESKIKGQINA